MSMFKDNPALYFPHDVAHPPIVVLGLANRLLCTHGLDSFSWFAPDFVPSLLADSFPQATPTARSALRTPKQIRRFFCTVLAVGVFTTAGTFALAQNATTSSVALNQPPDQSVESAAKLEVKAFEGALSFAQSLTGWSLLIIAGSIVVIVGTSYHRPQTLRARLIYLLFLPGWIFLVCSMKYGVSVQRVYLAYLFANPTEEKIKRFKDTIGEDSLNQIRSIEIALIFFVVWLILYLIWWLFNRDPQPGKG